MSPDHPHMAPSAANAPFNAPFARPAALPCEASPELWVAEHGHQLVRAKAACGPCPVREACLGGALARREPAGVWGGEIFVDGEVVAFKRGRGRPPRSESATRPPTRSAGRGRSPQPRSATSTTSRGGELRRVTRNGAGPSSTPRKNWVEPSNVPATYTSASRPSVLGSSRRGPE
jgi:WhiB family transcriptional regulator, redox-sensing transcriptional regulator